MAHTTIFHRFFVHVWRTWRKNAKRNWLSWFTWKITIKWRQNVKNYSNLLDINLVARQYIVTSTLCRLVQYPISFALNLAIPTDKAIGAKQVYCASATSPTEAADSARTKNTGSGSKADETEEDALKVSGAHL